MKKYSENRVLAGTVCALCALISVFGLGGWKLKGQYDKTVALFTQGDGDGSRYCMEAYLDRASEYAMELSEESRQYLSDEEQAARVEEAAMELSAENGPVSGRYEIYRSLTRSVERLYSDLQAAGKQDEAAIALAYGDYLSVGDLIKRDAYPEKAEAYNKTAGAFPAKLLSGLWGVGQLDTFGR